MTEKKIVTFLVNGNKEVPGMLFGTNIESSLEGLQKNLEKKLNELKMEGFNIISIVPENEYSGGANISIYITLHQVMIVAESKLF